MAYFLAQFRKKNYGGIDENWKIKKYTERSM